MLFKSLSCMGHPAYYASEKGIIVKRLKRNKVKLMKQTKNKKGYLSVSLTTDSKRKMIKVHKIILTVFKGKRPKGKQCRHLNGNPSDNRLKNLKWGTPKQNGEDRIKHGTSSLSGRNYSISDEVVRLIRKLYDPLKRNGRKLAKRFGVSNVYVYSLIHNPQYRGE